MTFSFGKNWKNYVRNVVSEEEIKEAKQSLLKYLPKEEYKDKTFIDVGCGSGLFSLAAILLGASKVISFDIDKESIEATKMLRKKFLDKIPPRVSWEIFQGDILNESLVDQFRNTGGIVYSWGVLHHTGKMYSAIENTTKLVKNDGYLILAIYNYAPSSFFWLKVKRFYNQNKWIQPLLNLVYGSYMSIGYMIRRKTLNLKRNRGMHVFYDAIDWLGGYPYEFACFEDIKNFVESLGFELIKAPTKLPCGKNKKSSLIEIIRSPNTGCNEFVFKKL